MDTEEKKSIVVVLPEDIPPNEPIEILDNSTTNPIIKIGNDYYVGILEEIDHTDLIFDGDGNYVGKNSNRYYCKKLDYHEM